MEGRQYQNVSKEPKFKTVYYLLYNSDKQLPGAASDGTASTFQFAHEDHTLGNALRYMIMKKYMLQDS